MALDAGGAAMALHEPEGEVRVGKQLGRGDEFAVEDDAEAAEGAQQCERRREEVSDRRRPQQIR